MMPGARFFFLSHVQLFVLPDGRAGRADYNQLRRAAANLAIKCATYRRSNDGRKSCLYETPDSSQTA
jgi:hypothetical protein